MTRLVDDLIDAARWARGKVSLRTCRHTALSQPAFE
jgi:hypothetical protein